MDWRVRPELPETTHKKLQRRGDSDDAAALDRHAASAARRKRDRVADSDDTALGRGEAQPVEGTDHARDDAAVRQVTPAVAHVADAAVATDHEARRDATFEVRILHQALLVAHTEAPEVLAYRALDDFRWQPAAHRGRTWPHLRNCRLVRIARAIARDSEAIVEPETHARTAGRHAAETDLVAASAAAFLVARVIQATRAGDVADRIAPQIADRAHRVGAERGVAAPRYAQRGGVTVHRVEQADDAHRPGFTQRGLARQLDVVRL